MTLEQYLLKHYSKTTLKSNLLKINAYIARMGKRAETASYNDVLEYVAHLRKQNLHPKTLRNRLAALKIYYAYLILVGKRKDHPCNRLYLRDKTDKTVPLESLYRREDLENLLQTHETEKKHLEKRNRIIIGLLIYQALTASEIVELEVKDIDLQKGEIRIKEQVQQKGRTLALKPGQIMLLHEYITEDRPKILKYNPNPTEEERKTLLPGQYGNKLKPSALSRVINSRRKKQGKLLPLKIRQSVIAHLLEQGHDLRIVQTFAGHRNTSSTEQYKQSKLEKLKTWIQKLHPLESISRQNQS